MFSEVGLKDFFGSKRFTHVLVPRPVPGEESQEDVAGHGSVGSGLKDHLLVSGRTVPKTNVDVGVKGVWCDVGLEECLSVAQSVDGTRPGPATRTTRNLNLVDYDKRVDTGTVGNS